MLRQQFIYGMVLMLGGVLSACMGNGSEDEMKKRQLEIRSDLETRIAEVDRAIDRLKEKAKSAGEQAREGMDSRIEQLEETRDDLSQKLDEVGDTTAGKWDEFTRSVKRSLDNAEQALKDI